MLRTLSYLNLIFAVLYFLAYLLNGNHWVVLGLLITVVFNWMILRGMETEQLKWSFFQWLTGIITVLFASWLGYSTILLLMNTIEYHYYPAETVVLIISGLLFSFTIFLQLLISLYKKNR
ncbi:uncharacterized membrane protein YjjP (DUF1212 family) [Pedobacter cryoconitis]|uniref:Uncharacterized membrane protein YjjP (DUF1212 family) n=1 Tax=Pedobacter cryoconitis TaxID=188932 RepID=A0A7W8ZKS6_9SPHI|nr:hypothetical protein [Pedobacter cryoconitis]MBB5635608.1 uncharacterized membrane protein YjjP (DUF1212 family) [Pedobacter cryoconitis]